MENHNIHFNQNQPEKSSEQSEKHQENFYQGEDEIDLRDYWNTLVKRKWAILTIFLIAVIATAIISLVMPQTFEATNLVEIGRVKNEPIETFAEIKTVFERPAILKEIHNKLGLTEEIKVESVAEKFVLKEGGKTSDNKFIEIKGRGETPEKAVETANVVTQILIDRHKQLFAKAEEMFNTEVESINKSKEKTQKDIIQIQKDIAQLEQDIETYEQRINQRDDTQSEAQGLIAEGYSNLLVAAKNQKENKELQLLDIEQQLIALDQQIQEKEYEKAYQTKPTEIEIPAVPPETRISPKRKQNVIIAGILGLFIGVLYAFGAEYVSKVKEV